MLRRRPLKALAYAKVNLSLEVLGPRSDGYHQVITVLQTVDLFDRLSFEHGDQISVECSRPGLSGEANLAWRAASALRDSVPSGAQLGVAININKGIPLAMGLGGGSSDAAATLVALDRLWRLDLPLEALEDIGRGLGSDVPFFIRGGTALGEERGDVLHRLRPLEDRWLVLVCPDITLESKTARLYAMLSPHSHTDGRLTRSLAHSIHRGQLSSDMLFNVFEQVAMDAFPGLDRAMEDMNQAGAEFVHLSGTGPALYSLVEDPSEGQRMVGRLAGMGRTGHVLRTTGASSILTLLAAPN